jgi:hypothetical protein
MLANDSFCVLPCPSREPFDVGEMNKVVLFKTRVDEAFKSVSFILKSSAHWMQLFHDNMLEKYTKMARILKLCWTHWNSRHLCLASLLHVLQAREAWYALYIQ